MYDLFGDGNKTNEIPMNYELIIEQIVWKNPNLILIQFPILFFTLNLIN